MVVCAKCAAENEDDAAYCDQCAAALERAPAADEDADDEDDRCPDCGGAVRALPDGGGVCEKCGARLRVREQPKLLSERLSEAIKLKMKAGMALELAVDSSCRELLDEDSEDRPALSPDAPAVCPVCGKDNSGRAERCCECGLSFEASAEPGACPKCGDECSGEECECGAILTLGKLVELLDPTVLYVCPKCRQLFNAVTLRCSDCGSNVVPADRLKRYAASKC